MKKEFTPYQQEAIEIINLLNHLREHLEYELQNYLPGAKISLHVTNIVLLAPAEKLSRTIYTDEKGRQYIITSVGASDMQHDYQDWHLTCRWNTYKISTDEFDTTEKI
jgi:hypothetical protein